MNLSEEDYNLIRIALQEYIAAAHYYVIQSPSYGPYTALKETADKMQELMNRVKL